VEFLELCGRLHHIEAPLLKRRMIEFAEPFGLTEALSQRISSYSKGMRKKLALISALLHDPEMLFLDEPLDGLDVAAQGLVKALVRSLASAGKTIFYCSHVLEVVERVCDRVLIIDKGKVLVDGPVAEVAARASSLEELFRQITGAADAQVQAGRIQDALGRRP
jgi:ABC-2 type transport system ATP-binding protein